MSQDRNCLLFRSELFLDQQADEDLGRWFLGGDCLGWIYARLLPHAELEYDCHPLMEDWGWYARIRTRDKKIPVELALYSYIDRHWLLWLMAKDALLWRKPREQLEAAQNCVADAIDAMIAGDDCFTSLGWRVDDKFEVVQSMQPRKRK